MLKRGTCGDLWNVILILCIEMILKSKTNTIEYSHLESHMHTLNLYTLKQVQIIFRHGISVPEIEVLNLFGNNIETRSWPNAPGQQTTDGKHYQYKLAQYLRKRYDGFISTEFIKDEVKMYSSNSKSCQESLKITLQELYSQLSDPHSKSGNEEFEIAVDSIYSLHTITDQDDNILKMSKSCMRWDTLYDSAKIKVTDIMLNDYSIKEDDERGNFPIADYISDHSGIDGSDLDNIRKLDTVLKAQKFCNISLPDWGTKLLDSKSFSNLVRLSYDALTYTEEMKRFKGGPLLKLIVDNFHENPIRNQGKIILYSGHAATLSSLLDSLSAFEMDFIEYSGALIFEFHENHFHIFYRNEMEEKEFSIKINAQNVDRICKDNNNNCAYKLTDLDRLSTRYGIENYDGHCDVIDESPSGFPWSGLLSSIFLLALFPILLFAFVKILYYHRSKNDEFSPLLRSHKVF